MAATLERDLTTRQIVVLACGGVHAAVLACGGVHAAVLACGGVHAAVVD